MADDLIEAVLTYAELLGLSLHPVAPDCRTPLLARDKDAAGQPIPNTGGVKKATKDPARLRELWTAYPTANVACATGAPSGAWVLDVDVKGANGMATLQRMEGLNGLLPSTWVTVTPSGGRHIWFRHDPKRPIGNPVGFAAGLDVRATGGSAAMPPSSKANGAYYWLVEPFDHALADAPDWLYEVIAPPRAPLPPRKPLRVESSDRTARYVCAAVNDECHKLATFARGGRNLKLFQASAQVGQFVGAGLLGEASAWDALTRAAEECGLVSDDGLHGVQATIRSGLTKGIANPREITR